MFGKATVAAGVTGACLLLLATSAAAAVTAQPSSLSFAKQKLGKQSAPQTVTVTGGACPDPIMGMDFCTPQEPNFRMDVAISGDFVITANNCPPVLLTMLSPAKCAISVASKPAGRGRRQGFLRLQSSPSIVGVPLNGIGCKKKKRKGSRKKKLVCK